jgi:signal transduction histidine kinase
LSVLEVVDSTDHVIGSGHFRNDFGRSERPLIQTLRLAANEGFVMARFPLPDGRATALVAAESISVAGQTITMVGGRVFDSSRVQELGRGREMAVRLTFGAAGPADSVQVLQEAPFVDVLSADSAGSSRVIAIEDPSAFASALESLNRWLAGAFAGALGLAGLAAWWIGGALTRPIDELAERTERIDLERLDADLAVDRDDEIGVLARGLDRLTSRLRASTVRLRETERRATVGDLARQVNHDIKNGLAPIRHVLRHLNEVAEREPAQLMAVYGERRGTLDSSVEYLDRLARTYARLSPDLEQTPADPNLVIAEIARAAPSGMVATDLGPRVTRVKADPVVLRRIVENLMTNGLEALGGRGGRVTISTRDTADRRVRVVIADTGGGIAKDQLDRIFDDFYTTKPNGTGLGLSVVRRLVADLGGSLRIESTPGAGTTVTVELPSA